MKTADYVKRKKNPPRTFRMFSFRISDRRRRAVKARMKQDGIDSTQALGEAMIEKYLKEGSKK